VRRPVTGGTLKKDKTTIAADHRQRRAGIGVACAKPVNANQGGRVCLQVTHEDIRYGSIGIAGNQIRRLTDKNYESAVPADQAARGFVLRYVFWKRRPVSR